jgi:hypothetical protein
MSNTQDEIKDIVAQLQRLQIQETELLQRLERLNEADSNSSIPQQNARVVPPSARSAPPTARATRVFVIGDLVRIKNPKLLQANQGTIIRIGVGTDRITVQTRNGSKIVRASSNLIHLD